MKYQEIQTNNLEVKSYDEVTGYVGRCRKPMVDWVTEYIFISENSLSLEQFEVMLEGRAYGNLTFIKKVLKFANGKKLFKHICKAVMY